MKESGTSISYPAKATLLSLEFSEVGKLNSKCSSEVTQKEKDCNPKILFQCLKMQLHHITGHVLRLGDLIIRRDQ